MMMIGNACVYFTDSGSSSLYPSPRSLITSDPWRIGAAVGTGAGGAQQTDSEEAGDVKETLEGQEAEGAGPVVEPIDNEEAESEAEPKGTKQEPKDPVQVRGSRGRGEGQGSQQMKGSEERSLGVWELLRPGGEPAEWREDDQGPDLDQKEAEEEGGLQEKVGASSHGVAGKVLESLAI